MRTLIMKLPYTEMKIYPNVKCQNGLSSLWVSCKRALSCIEVPNLIVFCSKQYCMFALGQSLSLQSFSFAFFDSFLIELTFLNPISTFSRNLNYHWKCREQKSNPVHNISELYSVHKVTDHKHRSDPQTWYTSCRTT